MSDPEPAALACLEQTRSSVLNVLVAAGVTIAASGLALRWRDGWADSRAPGSVGPALIGALLTVVVVSTVARKLAQSRRWLRDPATRATRFWRGHVVAAVLGALAVPLGFAYGWYVRPRLDGVAPFWVAGLALGFLALPRGAELEGFDGPLPGPGSEPGP